MTVTTEKTTFYVLRIKNTNKLYSSFHPGFYTESSFKSGWYKLAGRGFRRTEEPQYYTKYSSYDAALKDLSDYISGAASRRYFFSQIKSKKYDQSDIEIVQLEQTVTTTVSTNSVVVTDSVGSDIELFNYINTLERQEFFTGDQDIHTKHHTLFGTKSFLIKNYFSSMGIGQYYSHVVCFKDIDSKKVLDECSEILSGKKYVRENNLLFITNPDDLLLIKLSMDPAGIFPLYLEKFHNF